MSIQSTKLNDLKFKQEKLQMEITDKQSQLKDVTKAIEELEGVSTPLIDIKNEGGTFSSKFDDLMDFPYFGRWN